MESLGLKIRRRCTKNRPTQKIINWGGSALSLTGPVKRVVNPPEVVKVAGNKLMTFQALENKDGIRIPLFTRDHNVAVGWIRDGISIVCRTKLTGHSGVGIVLANVEADLVAAPLYVQYIKKQDEYRVHVAFGEVIDIQQKKKRRVSEDENLSGTNYQVRNHSTGWVYCREDINLPTGASDMAIQAVAALGLDFGACDLIYNAKRDMVYVLEVNTAPGLEGATVDKYATAFVKALK
jgi:glutathione synthase/RimK-type ligase-like ATP-grasp enzyme